MKDKAEIKGDQKDPELKPKPGVAPTCKPMQEGTGDAVSRPGPEPEPE